MSLATTPIITYAIFGFAFLGAISLTRLGQRVLRASRRLFSHDRNQVNGSHRSEPQSDAAQSLFEFSMHYRSGGGSANSPRERDVGAIMGPTTDNDRQYRLENIVPTPENIV
ncbi:hypothetical protein SISSUDRAFT_1050393 [Sistotremastrum suecicum HHB10207 ss-3]|uniref:Uncharacterized protein n=1 Tax=Sistotremastrum suecicum HHB10207 ss-3 TaxID=1314776 RepID=A0A166B8Q2_9AGAM|nr:hypothetical protein SISSUDRAFT_1050393 [Sistotremastrum suecicum HHB10207 ss-3]